MPKARETTPKKPKKTHGPAWAAARAARTARRAAARKKTGTDNTAGRAEA